MTYNKPKLTKRELEVLQVTADLSASAPRSNLRKEVANILVVSPPTIHAHYVHIFNKLNVNSQVGAVAYCFRQGWLH